MADNFSYVSILNPGFATVPNTGPMAAGTFGYVSFVNPPSTVTASGGGGGATVNGSTGAVTVVGGPNVTVSNSSGSIYVVGQDITVQDEGGAPVTAKVFNFAGAGVTVTVVGDTATITVPGGGTPGGSNKQVQFNSAGVFAGSADLTFDSVTKYLTGVNIKASNAFVLPQSAGADAVIMDNTPSGLGDGFYFSKRIWAPSVYADTLTNYALPVSALMQIIPTIVDTAGAVTALKVTTNLNTYNTSKIISFWSDAGFAERSYLTRDGKWFATAFNGALVGNADTATTLKTSGSTTWDPASLAPGAYVTQTVTVTGAVLGNGAVAALGVALPAGVMLTAAVTAVDTVTVTLWNLSGTAQDLASSTLKAWLVT